MIETIRMQSEALGRNVLVNVIRPDDGRVSKLLILLHGKMYPEMCEELFFNIPGELELENLCDKHQMMIVIPLMENRYYISTADCDCDKYVAKELPDDMKKRYCLPDAVDMMLAGVSMGGYGSALIAARTGVFQKIISISGAFIAEDVKIGNPEVWGELTPDSERLEDSFLYYFLPLETLDESLERNAAMAAQLFKEGKESPEFLLSCGTKDWLYKRNLDFIKILETLEITCHFERIAGGEHNSECFKTGLWNALEYVMGI